MDELWKNYAKNPSDENRNAIVIKSRWLVRFTIEATVKTLPPSIDPCDIEQVGLVALIESVDRFNTSHDTAFSTFASYRIRGAIKTFLHDEAGWCESQLQSCPVIEHEFPNVDTPQEVFAELCKGMRHDSQEILELRYIDGLTFKQIAKQIGMSHSSVIRNHSKSLEKLRLLLGPDGSARSSQ